MAQNQMKQETLQQAVSAHADLLAQLKRIKANWPSADALKVASRLNEFQAECAALRENVATHFSAEENGSFSKKAKAAGPELSGQVTFLLRQHAELLQLFDVALNELRSGEKSTKTWGAATLEFEKFVREFQRHEEEEDQFLSAYERETGTGD